MNKKDKIYVAGHRGMVGSAIVREFKKLGFDNIVTRTSKELDLRIQSEVESFFENEKPDYVVLAAAKVGGILANNIYRVNLPWNGSLDDSVYTTLVEESSGDFINPMGYDSKANLLLTNSTIFNDDDFSQIFRIKTIDVAGNCNIDITNDLLIDSYHVNKLND